MEKYILVLDSGSTNVKASLIDKQSRVFSSSAAEFPILYPKEGFVEESGTVIWGTIVEMIRKVISKSGISLEQIDCIGITNQRETFLVWDRETGVPIYNGIGWQDKRGMPLADQLVAEGRFDEIFKKTGQFVSNFVSPAGKLTWVLDHVEGARERAEKGELAFGTIDTWIIWNLTQGKNHVTDPGNASRTLYFNVNTLQWDEELLNLFRIPSSLLAEIKDTGSHLGYATGIFKREIPIMSGVADAHAATFGQRCFEKGMVQATYGSTCIMLTNAGHNPSFYPGLGTTVGWRMNGETVYLYEGAFFMAGLTLKWIRDVMHLVDDYETMNRIAENTKATEGLYFSPSFLGVATPHFVPEAKGIMSGVGITTGPNDLIKASMDSIAYTSRDCIDTFAGGLGKIPSMIAVGGGVTGSDYIMQGVADVTGVEIKRGKNVEATTLGAAYIAGLASGFWASVEDIEGNLENNETVFQPGLEREEANRRYDGWLKTVKANLGLYRE